MFSQIILFSQPRTASHLLERMLSKQTNVDLLEHPFSSSRGKQLEWLQSENYADGMELESRSAFETEIIKGVQKWEESLTRARNKEAILMVHLHAFFPVSPNRIIEYIKRMAQPRATPSAENFTLIPDDFLLHPSTTPIFTIRNPRLVVPSAHRTMNAMGILHGGGQPNFLIVTWQIWNRVLYDFYVAKGIAPVVVETDDYITSEEFVRKLCAHVGLDATQACLSWEPATQVEKEKIHPMYYASQSTLINSSGPDAAFASKTRDLEREEKQWEKEFGGDAELMRELVTLAMPHYTYLREKRTRIEGL